MSRRRLAAVLGVCAASVVLAACGSSGGIEGSDGGATGHPTAKAQGKPSGDLTISNWALYIDKKTIPEFEQATGINVHYVEDINSYDEFFGKMQPLLSKGESGGAVADGGRRLARAKEMYDLGYIQKLDHEGARAGVLST